MSPYCSRVTIVDLCAGHGQTECLPLPPLKEADVPAWPNNSSRSTRPAVSANFDRVPSSSSPVQLSTPTHQTAHRIPGLVRSILPLPASSSGDHGVPCSGPCSGSFMAKHTKLSDCDGHANKSLATMIVVRVHLLLPEACSSQWLITIA